MKLINKLSTGLTSLMVAVHARAEITDLPAVSGTTSSTSFLDKLEDLFCSLFSANGKLMGMLVVGSIIAFAIALMFSEEKSGPVTMAIKIGLGISIAAGAVGIASFFGIGFQCDSTALNFQL